MAIVRVGFKSGEKSAGSDPTGQKLYLVESDTKISDDIDQVLDASGIPAYNSVWSGDTTINLLVSRKRAQALDVEEQTQEGFYWIVQVDYRVPDTDAGQTNEDPTDRDWLWSKTNEKSDRLVNNSLFDTAGYIFPESDANHMKNLTAGEAVTNTAGEPPEGGITGPVSKQVITLSKYIDVATDLGVASFEALDAYVDSINSASVTILGQTYDKWQLLMDDISYEPVSINGYDVIRVVFRIVVDTFKTHVFSFVSAGFNEKRTGTFTDTLTKIVNDNGEDVVAPRLLDKDGKAENVQVANIEPTHVSVGINELKDFTTINFPAAIP